MHLSTWTHTVCQLSFEKFIAACGFGIHHCLIFGDTFVDFGLCSRLTHALSKLNIKLHVQYFTFRFLNICNDVVRKMQGPVLPTQIYNFFGSFFRVKKNSCVNYGRKSDDNTGPRKENLSSLLSPNRTHNSYEVRGDYF